MSRLLFTSCALIRQTWFSYLLENVRASAPPHACLIPFLLHNHCRFVTTLSWHCFLCGCTHQQVELPAPGSAPSRFAFNQIIEDEAPKPSNVVRGKDGHVKLGGGGDFFSDPLAAPAPSRSTTRCSASAGLQVPAYGETNMPSRWAMLAREAPEGSETSAHNSIAVPGIGCPSLHASACAKVNISIAVRLHAIS